MKLNYYLENVDNLIVKNIFGNESSTQLISGLVGLQVVRNPDSVLQTIISNISSILVDLMDLNTQMKYRQKMEDQRKYMVKAFSGFNQTNAFPAFFTTIWYTILPCFDLDGITSEKIGEKARYNKPKSGKFKQKHITKHINKFTLILV